VKLKDLKESKQFLASKVKQ